MQAHRNKLFLTLSVISTFIYILAACQKQRMPITEPTNTSLFTPSLALDSPATPVPQTLSAPASMQIGRVIPLGDDFPFALAFARKSLWVLMRKTSFLPPGSILQIDPQSGRIVGGPIQVDFDPWSFAVTEEAIWVAKNGPAAVAHIDPETQHIMGLVEIDASLVAADTYGVWVSGAGENAANANTAWRVDPLTDQLIGTPIAVGIEPLQIVAGAGAIWVGAHSGAPAITRIDSATGQVVATIEVGFGIHGLAAGPDSVWAVDYHGQKVVRISPQTNQMVSNPIPVPFAPYAVAASGTDAWVGATSLGDQAVTNDDRVARLDLRTNRIIDTIHVGGPVSAMTFAEGSLWVATVRPSAIVQVIPRHLLTATP